MDPEMLELGRRINEAFAAGVMTVGTIVFVLWFFVYAPDGQPTVYQRLRQRYFPVMSPDEEEDASSESPEFVGSAGSERTHEPPRTAFPSDGTTRTPPFVDEPDAGAFVLSLDETTAVQKMYAYALTTARSGGQPAKSKTIEAGFGLKRGGGARYQRASEIYDMLFGPPEPAVVYPALTPEQEQSRRLLRLPVHGRR